MASGLQKLRDRQKAHGLSDLERPHGRPRRRAGSFRHLMGGGRRPSQPPAPPLTGCHPRRLVRYATA